MAEGAKYLHDILDQVELLAFLIPLAFTHQRSIVMKEPMTITYTFDFSGGDTVVSEVRLDPVTLERIYEPPKSPPDWIALDFHQCKNCPLSSTEIANCPLAETLFDIVETFSDRISHEEVALEVRTEHRNYTSKTSLQNALRSLMGIYMASSECPHLEPLRPLLLTHLPLADVKESSFRVVSMYLMAQYFLEKHGQQPDWKLERMRNMYEEIHKVNLGLLDRFMAVSTRDANINSIVGLDVFTYLVPRSIESHLDQYEPYFLPYLQQQDPVD